MDGDDAVNMKKVAANIEAAPNATIRQTWTKAQESEGRKFAEYRRAFPFVRPLHVVQQLITQQQDVVRELERVGELLDQENPSSDSLGGIQEMLVQLQLSMPGQF